jgi:hypothetical protein
MNFQNINFEASFVRWRPVLRISKRKASLKRKKAQKKVKFSFIFSLWILLEVWIGMASMGTPYDLFQSGTMETMSLEEEVRIVVLKDLGEHIAKWQVSNPQFSKKEGRSRAQRKHTLEKRKQQLQKKLTL